MHVLAGGAWQYPCISRHPPPPQQQGVVLLQESLQQIKFTHVASLKVVQYRMLDWKRAKHTTVYIGQLGKNNFGNGRLLNRKDGRLKGQSHKRSSALFYWNERSELSIRVSEPACLGPAPAPIIFFPEPAPPPAPAPEDIAFLHIFGSVNKCIK